MVLRGLLVFLFFFPVQALAQWHEASSENFVVIADQNQKDVEAFTDRLERFHSAMNFLLGRTSTAPSPSNRVTVYVVRSEAQVKKLYGDKNSKIGGFYSPRAGGSLAFVPRVEGRGVQVTDTEQILFHEYAHHVLLSASSRSWPLWLGEGAAEFYSTARFEKEGAVGLGAPANHRAAELAYAREVPLKVLLDSAGYQKFKSSSYDDFYGQSWLLYHFLQLSGRRDGQLTQYQIELNNGASELAAAEKVFGDLKALQSELNAYQRRPKLNYVRIPGDKLTVGSITTRRMRPGEVEMMPIILESKRGVDNETSGPLYARAKAVAAKYPDDPTVQAALAEAAQDADDHDGAIAAAEKALAVDPNKVNAHVQKILALTSQARDADDEAAWKKVRAASTRLNKIEPDHPSPLIHYYLSQARSGQKVTKLAAEGLYWAMRLAPYDKGLRMMAVRQLMNDGEWELASRAINPLVNDPHNRSADNPANALMQDISENLAKAKATPAATSPKKKP